MYPRFMPDSVHPLHRPTRVEQFVAWMRDRSDVDVLDLRPPLAERARLERVYHKTDSHWNDRGALVAYLEIQRRLAGRMSGMTEWRAEHFTPTETDGPGQDLARMLGLEDVLGERILGVRPSMPRVARVVEPERYDPGFGEARVVTERPGNAGPTAVVFRDSFGSALVPFLAENFGRAVFLWQKDFDPQAVLQERPQVVIQELASRFFAVHWPYDAVADGTSH
jgi:hypothetical protein